VTTSTAMLIAPSGLSLHLVLAALRARAITVDRFPRPRHC